MAAAGFRRAGIDGQHTYRRLTTLKGWPPSQSAVRAMALPRSGQYKEAASHGFLRSGPFIDSPFSCELQLLRVDKRVEGGFNLTACQA